jgi:hypothetical protein
MSQPSWTSRAISELRGIVLSTGIGLFGGIVCGGTILSLCALAGRIQTTGDNYIGFWDWSVLAEGTMFGGPIGAILGFISYIPLSMTIGLRRAILPAAIGTVLCGFLGSLYTPLMGLPAGVLGFFVGIGIEKLGSHRRA